MRILVTGGAGFIGSAYIRHTISHTEDEVINVDKLTYAANLASLTPISSSERYFFEQADICDRHQVESLFQTYKPDAVVNFAAESHVDRSIDGPLDFIHTNIVGVATLIEVARSFWKSNIKSGFRFHHVSTDEVYGDLERGTKALFTEKTAYAPSSPYAASKASSDHLVRAWHRTYGLPVVITNCSNNYGPYQFPEKLIPHMIIKALAGEMLPVYGDGLQIRDWLHVDDHVAALRAVLLSGRDGETYNIGGLNEVANLQVVNQLCSILDEVRPKTIGSYQEQIAFVQDRPGHDQRYAIDAGKITAELNWTPSYNFTTGLEQTVNWYLNNQDWWQSILSGNYKTERLGQA